VVRISIIIVIFVKQVPPVVPLHHLQHPDVIYETLKAARAQNLLNQNQTSIISSQRETKENRLDISAEHTMTNGTIGEFLAPEPGPLARSTPVLVVRNQNPKPAPAPRIGSSVPVVSDEAR